MTPTMQIMATRKRRLIGLLLAACLLLSPDTARASGGEIVFFGEGSGHGVGLSQYGAKAMAFGGATYRQILYRYYTGISVVPVQTAAVGTFVATEQSPLWVGLLQSESSISFTVDKGSADLCFDSQVGCVARALDQETWVFSHHGYGNCAFSRTGVDGSSTQIGESGRCDASIRPLSDVTTIAIPRKARSYKNGTLRMRTPLNDGIFHLVFQTDLEAYVRGISEVPETWPIEAVKAQVVATRSLAAWTLLVRGSEQSFSQSQRSECHCNLRDDVSDQVFRGYDSESRHPNWVSAVKATGSEVIAVSGGVGRGLYFHSSAGVTEDYSDAFGEGVFPYLASVNDAPAISEFANNPLRYWGLSSKPSSLATLFNFSWVNNVLVESHNESGSVSSVRITGIRSGRPVEEIVDGAEFRRRLGLRSTNYEVEVRSPFSDVLPESSFSGEIVGLAAMGITEGCLPSRFCPTAQVTRGEMAAFLVRALRLDPGQEELDAFSDDNGSYFENEINTLHVHGITNGCAEAKFCPNQFITRGEMAAFLVRAFDLPESSGDSFSDDDWSLFEADIAALEASGVTSGCGTGRFCPDRPVSRQEMAAFLIRALALG